MSPVPAGASAAAAGALVALAWSMAGARAGPARLARARVRAHRARRPTPPPVAVARGAVVAGPGLRAVAPPALAAAATWWLLGGGLGLVGGLAVGVVLGRRALLTEPAQTRQRRLLLARSLPPAVSLLAECVAAGASPESALRAVAAAAPAPLAAVLGPVAAELALGAAPARAWAPLSADPVLAPVARAMVRSADSGAPAAEGLRRCVDDLRRDRRARAATAAAAVGVQVAAPVGLCFLPAFVLLGIVPAVWGLVGPVLDAG